MRWAGHAVRIGANKNAYKILVGNPEGKGLPRTATRSWVDDIKMDLR
jgi:hypothetical protein